MEEKPQSFLYETLSPISVVTAVQSQTTDEDEPYSVFRNEISLDNLQCVSPTTAAPDFFSLDVGVDEIEPLSASPVTPSVAELATPVLEAERSLESGWFRGNRKFGSPMLQLHKEIVDFVEFLSPSIEEQDVRNSAVQRVFEVANYIWPNCKVEVFGSFRTGLYLPTSDIDVVILGSGIPTPQQGLKALSRALSLKGLAKNIQVIGKARVPIIKFVEKRSGIAFDISFDIESGPIAADFIKDAIAKWPPLRPLCLILKLFLQQRELNEVYSGGLGSYALLAMLMSMLQSLRESSTAMEQNLGILLVNFFDFYGRKLNTSDVGVSCRSGGTFFSKSSKGFINKARPFLIAIEDPQASDNDIGKSSFNYFQIRSAFSMAFTTLTNPKIILGLGPNRSILGTIIRPDPVLLERKVGYNGQVTFDSLLPGAGEPLQSHNDQHEILCNWQLDDEEPLPRGGDAAGERSEQSSGKKRKSSSKDKWGGDAAGERSEQSSGKKRKSSSKDKSRKKKKKLKDNGETVKVRNEENGSRKEKRSKKTRFRHNSHDVNGFGRNVGGWSN